MLKILQAKFQQYVHQEIPDIQAEVWRGRGTRDHIADIPWIMEKAKELQINSYFRFFGGRVGRAVVCAATKSQTQLSGRAHPGGVVVKNPPTSAGDTGSVRESWKSLGVWNGNQIQYSCSENPMCRGTGQTTVHGFTKNQTLLNDWAHIEHKFSRKQTNFLLNAIVSFYNPNFILFQKYNAFKI